MRRGPCTLLCAEPLGPWRTARATTRRTGVDGARPVQARADHPRDRQILACDSLNAHAYASLYRALPPAEARRLARRVQRVLTPRHDRWLHRAEPELSVLTRQALTPRRPRFTRRSARRRRSATRSQKDSTTRYFRSP